MTGEYTVADTTTVIGESAFYHCNGITTIHIGKNVKAIEDAVEKIERIMNELNITTDNRKVVRAALDYTQKVQCPVVAIEVGKHIVYGKKTELFTASAAAVTVFGTSIVPFTIDFPSYVNVPLIFTLKSNV